MATSPIFWLQEGALQASWGSFGGQDVCPWCQTEDERREVTRRLVDMTEREVDHRQKQGIPPEPWEGALVAYAMSLRAGADEAGSLDADDDSSAEGDQVRPLPSREPFDRPDGRRLSVAVTGTFLTGHPAAIRLGDYADFQRRLGDILKWPRWSLHGPQVGGGTFRSGGGFTGEVPLVVAHRDGFDRLALLTDALSSPADPSASPFNRLLTDLHATPKRLSIDVYDLGVAVMTAWFDVVARTESELGSTARAVKQLSWLRPQGEHRSPLVEALQKVATETAGEYGEALAKAAPGEIQVSWLSRAAQLAPGEAVDSEAGERGRLLWLHPVHVLSAPEPHKDIVKALSPVFSQRVRLEGGVFVPGIGASIILAAPLSGAAEAPLKLTQLHWAYYALYMEIDRGLLGVLNQPRWSRTARLKRLEQDAENVFADYLRVMNARARLDSALSVLGGDELAIWDTISKVQRFDAVVDAVERKLDVLEKVAQHRVAQATTDRARRITSILGCLSVLTVVTVFIAIIGATLGSVPGAGSVFFRVVSIMTAFVVALLLYWFAFVRTAGGRDPDDHDRA